MFYKTTQNKITRHSSYFSHLRNNAFFVLLCSNTHVFCKIFSFVYFLSVEKKVILTASTQRYTAQKHTHTYTYSLSALWPLSPPLLASLSCSVNNIVSVGWGCDVVSCKAWPFLRFARTSINKHTTAQKDTESCTLPVLSQWYWGAISL